VFQDTCETIVIKRILVQKDKDMEKQLSAFKIECEILRTFKHQNIVQTYDVPNELLDANQPSLAMEYCSMGDLRKVEMPVM